MMGLRIVFPAVVLLLGACRGPQDVTPSGAASGSGAPAIARPEMPPEETARPAATRPAATSPAATPAAAAMPEKITYENTIKWSTASEVDNFGYDVYRGPSETGPFTRLTPEPIPGAGTTDETTSYAYVDDTIDPYEIYWYYVESISMGGERVRFTPIFPSKPKLPREAGE